MTASGIQLAKRYLQESAALRDALRIPARTPLNAEALGQGEHNANFWFAHPHTGEKFVLRINYVSQLGLSQQATYEYCALRELEPSARTPRALFLDDTKSIIPHGVLVESFCEGRHLDFARTADIKEAARILADIHSVAPHAKPLTLAAPHTATPLFRSDEPLREQYEECLRLYNSWCTSSFYETRIARQVEALFAGAEAHLNTPLEAQDCAHIINTEAVPSHFLISSHNQNGFMVDWEKPIVGEAAQDVAYFLVPTTTLWDTNFIFSAERRAAFINDYWAAVDGRFPRGNFDARYRAYCMTNCLRGVTWSLAAWVEYHDPARPLQNEKTRKKLAIYQDEAFLELLKREFFTP